MRVVSVADVGTTTTSTATTTTSTATTTTNTAPLRLTPPRRYTVVVVVVVIVVVVVVGVVVVIAITATSTATTTISTATTTTYTAPLRRAPQQCYNIVVVASTTTSTATTSTSTTTTTTSTATNQIARVTNTTHTVLRQRLLVGALSEHVQEVPRGLIYVAKASRKVNNGAESRQTDAELVVACWRVLVVVFRVATTTVSNMLQPKNSNMVTETRDFEAPVRCELLEAFQLGIGVILCRRLIRSGSDV